MKSDKSDPMTPRQTRILKMLGVDLEEFLRADYRNWQQALRMYDTGWGPRYTYSGPTVRTANNLIIEKLREQGIGTTQRRGERAPWRMQYDRGKQ